MHVHVLHVCELKTVSYSIPAVSQVDVTGMRLSESFIIHY